jgi:hypothetical protein
MLVGMPTNIRALSAFRHHVGNLWRRSLTRRSDKDSGLRLLQAKLSRNPNRIAPERIRRFESYMPSHAVRLSTPDCSGDRQTPRPRKARSQFQTIYDRRTPGKQRSRLD